MSANLFSRYLGLINYDEDFVFEEVIVLQFSLKRLLNSDMKVECR